MSQFMLVMLQQFTITLEKRFQAPTNRSGSWHTREQSWITNNCRFYCDNL